MTTEHKVRMTERGMLPPVAGPALRCGRSGWVLDGLSQCRTEWLLRQIPLACAGADRGDCTRRQRGLAPVDRHPYLAAWSRQALLPIRCSWRSSWPWPADTRSTGNWAGAGWAWCTSRARYTSTGWWPSSSCRRSGRRSRRCASGSCGRRGSRQSSPTQHHPDPRGGRDRRVRLLRDGVRGRGDSGRTGPDPGSPARGRGRPGAAGGGLGAGPRSWPGPGAPRRQAGQHPAGGGERPGAGRGFRHRGRHRGRPAGRRSPVHPSS